MDERRIARIREMETALNKWVDLGNKGEELLEVMTSHLPSLERLVAYYSSPDWMRDHDASDEGAPPTTIFPMASSAKMPSLTSSPSSMACAGS